MDQPLALTKSSHDMGVMGREWSVVSTPAERQQVCVHEKLSRHTPSSSSSSRTSSTKKYMIRIYTDNTHEWNYFVEISQIFLFLHATRRTCNVHLSMPVRVKTGCYTAVLCVCWLIVWLVVFFCLKKPIESSLCHHLCPCEQPQLQSFTLPHERLLAQPTCWSKEGQW